MRKLIALILLGAMTMTSCAIVEGNDLPDNSKPGQSEEAPARPQDDYYRFVNEDFLKTVKFKYKANTAGGSFDQDMITDEVRQILDEVVKGSGYEAGSEEDILQRAYKLHLAYDYENSPVPQKLQDMIEEIKNADTLEKLLDADAKMSKEFAVQSLLNASVTTNYLSPGRYDLSFKNYDEILGVDFKDLLDSYSSLTDIKNYGSDVLQYIGYDKKDADQAGTRLAYIVMDIYNATNMDILDDSMPLEYMEEIKPDEAKKIFSNLDLYAYLEKSGYDTSKIDRFETTDKEQMAAVNLIFKEENLDALKAWELSNLLKRYTDFIAPSSDILIKYYNKNYKSAEDQAAEKIMHVFYDQTDPLYVERYYTAVMDKYLRDMCDDIKEGYRKLIKEADWLTEETRAGLLRKLDNIIYVTGSDLKRHDNDLFKGLPDDNIFDFYIAYSRILADQNRAKLGTVSDRKDVNMPMQMFNACYHPSCNSITITVAMMNAPFYDKDADYYTNLGGIGFTVAHEMGHAFDSNCIVFDENGRYDPSWINKSDMDKLLARNKKASEYFEKNFTVFGVYHVDGDQTLGENYADLGGMECVASLAKNNEDLQKIFSNYAVTWREKTLDTYVFELLEHDEHSPAVIRVNAILATLDEFYRAYDVKEGDGMYIAPEDRISRWH